MHTNSRRKNPSKQVRYGYHSGSLRNSKKWYKRRSARCRRLWMKQLLKQGHYGTPCFHKHIRFDLS